MGCYASVNVCGCMCVKKLETTFRDETMSTLRERGFGADAYVYVHGHMYISHICLSKLPINRPHRQKNTPDKPAKNLLPVCRSSPSRVACRQTGRTSGFFADKALQRSRSQWTKKNDRMMRRHHTIMFPLSDQCPTSQKSLSLLDRSHP